jgi:hypothetical protein
MIRKFLVQLPMGFPWDKEDRKPTSNSINLFFLSYEEVEENKNGVKRESLPEPWYEVAYHLLKYITCEGRISMLYAYHFRFLHQLRNFSFLACLRDICLYGCSLKNTHSPTLKLVSQ